LTRARILLKADAAEGGGGWSDNRIAAALDISVVTGDISVVTGRREVRVTDKHTEVDHARVLKELSDSHFPAEPDRDSRRLNPWQDGVMDKHKSSVRYAPKVRA